MTVSRGRKEGQGALGFGTWRSGRDEFDNATLLFIMRWPDL